MSSKRSLRQPKVPLPQLREQVDDAERFLQEILSIKPISEDDLSTLDKFAIDVKCKRNKYFDLNRELCNRLLEFGATSESAELRDQRTFFFTQCQQFIKHLNTLRANLGADEVSNPDWRSETSFRTYASSEEQRLRTKVKLTVSEAKAVIEEEQDDVEQEQSLLDATKKTRRN